MYTAKITNKEILNGVMNVTVAFTDGTDTIHETCKPQDLEGFKFWVKSRLATFNGSKTIDTNYNVDDVVDVTDPVVTPPTPTQAEIDLDQWLKDYQLWIKVKTNLIDTEILTGSETQVVALKTKVQNNFKPAYINSL